MGTRRYIIRLDDACEKRDIEKWDRIEGLLDEYSIKPIVGVIPKCEDPKMENYPIDVEFWDRVRVWQNKGWSIAMHGYRHVYDSNDGGINPVNDYSEFAGNTIDIQRERVREGVKILKENDIEPRIFFAPAHTFDRNTLKALEEESAIRVISDTIAHDVYREEGFTFIPQQCGKVRKLPFRTVTFCYHPNTMNNTDFTELECFVRAQKAFFSDVFSVLNEGASPRKKTTIDCILRYIYFAKRRLS